MFLPPHLPCRGEQTQAFYRVKVERACAGCRYEVQPTADRKHVVVVALERLLREALSSCVQNLFPNCLVAEFESTRQALETLERAPADLTIADTQMEDMDGLDFINAVVTRQYASTCMVISRRMDERLLTFLSAAKPHIWLNGAQVGHLELCCGICMALQGQRFISRSLTEACLDRGKFIVQRFLSPLEQLIFSVLAEGIDDTTAAARIDSTPGTVRAHRDRIMRKLGVHQKTDLRAAAIRTGYLRTVKGANLHPGFEAELREIAIRGRRPRYAFAAPIGAAELQDRSPQLVLNEQ